VKPLAACGGKSLAWIQPASGKHRFELREGDTAVATLEWDGGLSSAATGVTADGRWSLQRVGFVRPRVLVRTADGKDAASYQPSWSGGGELSLADGRRLRMAPANLWSSEWRLADAEGRTLLRFRPDSGIVRTTARMEIDSAAVSSPDLSVAVLLTWSVLVLMADDLAVYGV
jgi:hypothetical protein